MLGGYGGKDRMFAAQGRRLEKLLTEMGVDHDVKLYDDAGHSFMSRNSGFLPWIGKIGPMKAAYNPEPPKTVGSESKRSSAATSGIQGASLLV